MKSPIKFTIKTEILPILILLFTAAVSVWAYPKLPATVISHWNFDGQPDAWSSKNFQAYFMPAVILAIYAGISLFPMIDPRKERYAEFSKFFLLFRGAILKVMASIYVISTLANLGYPLAINRVVPWIIGIMMIVIGNYFGKIKRNWFFGIKTPWTLSSENVWNKTHRLGGWLFVAFGIFLIILPFLTAKIGAIAFFIAIALLLLIPAIYSYLLFKREQSGK